MIKQTLQQLTRRILGHLPIIALLALLVGALVPIVTSAWGPSRQTFTTQNPADYVTFNSMTNNPAHGDERNFMQVREASASNETYADSIELKPGGQYVVYMYYHNNAATRYNESGQGVAQGAYVRAELPAIVREGASDTKAVGYVGAQNANPQQVWDDIAFSNESGGDIALRYVPGSATIHNFGPTNGQKLSDSIITNNGAQIGYQELNGVLPGCNEYAGYVTFRVQADQPNFTVTKEVRKEGATDWARSTELKPGDTAEYLISYKNTGSTQQSNVVVRDVLPAGMTYVEGSSVLTNTSNSDGTSVADGVITSTLNEGGINIGDYAGGAAAYVTFKAKVTGDEFTCGKTTLTNTAGVTTGNGQKSGTADVVVTVDDENCEPAVPPELPQTGPTEIIAGLIGLTLISLGVAYWIRSRNHYRRAMAGFTDDMTEMPEEKLLTSRTETHVEDDKKHF